ncbi:hypothetical protein Rsub_04884 [Raphidocelis subcapitata]|uniref:Cns1/TTC4 wheel domain-containing protein n=1 Tax=Raphidocelis subcapitata TaxID=307507 RepID=A0A2V0P2A7_9CHLO|nr:hypothetical protein Rsub_04884 [Raphidocelis subcapitata]|eukprot:GBF91215.1 hypothetical protein Rsub_04884 [Raphidocelis subcapitata]
MSDGSDGEGRSPSTSAGGGGRGDDPLDPAALPCLFWDEMPDKPEEHPDYAALQAIADECTPEERADSFRKQGNKKLEVGLKAKNRFLLREAVGLYTKGLELQSSEAGVNLALYNNRAHVHSLLGNWRNSLEDSQAARRLDPSNVKAAFRAARAAAKLGQLELAGRLVDGGLALDPASKELLKLQSDLAPARAAAEARARAEAEAEERRMAPARALAAALTARGYRLTRPQVAVGTRRPYADAAGVVHWPVLLMYPETLQQDVVEDWADEDCVADHLDVMFGEGAPPLPWDAAGEYSRARVELYYLANAGQPLTQPQLEDAMAGRWPEGLDRDAEGPTRYGAAAARWTRVDEALSLREVLTRPDHIVAGAPLFFVVAGGTEYRERFLTER